MNVYGKKIYLRAMEPDDMEMYRDMINNPDIEKMLGGGGVSQYQEKNRCYGMTKL